MRSVLSALAGLLLLAATIHNLDAAALSARISQLRARYLFLGSAIALPQLYLLATRWRLAETLLGGTLTQGRALREYALSMLLNQLLPFGVAGDAIRIVRHARGQRAAHSKQAAPAQSGPAAGFIGSRLPDRLVSSGQRAPVRLAADGGARPYSTALHSVLLERAMGQLVVIVWALAALPLWFGDSGAWLAGAAFTAMLLTALALRRLQLPAHVTPTPVPLVTRPLLRFAAALQRLLASPRLLLAQFWLSTAVVLSLIAQLYCALSSLGLSLAFPEAMQVFPLMLLSMALPISFAGFGPREAVTAQLYRALQLSAADGAAFAMATGAVVLCTSLPCLLLVLCMPRAKGPRA